mmetsp:Transcript_79509/g.143490  ORF Transcript_79509/g.143490 Transcript_79509/m.143490 type:complete len:175 (+) Transcript_79509:408-932(+)
MGRRHHSAVDLDLGVYCHIAEGSDNPRVLAATPILQQRRASLVHNVPSSLANAPATSQHATVASGDQHHYQHAGTLHGLEQEYDLPASLYVPTLLHGRLSDLGGRLASLAQAACCQVFLTYGRSEERKYRTFRKSDIPKSQNPSDEAPPRRGPRHGDPAFSAAKRDDGFRTLRF